MLKGRLTYRFADHEEVFKAGDALYQGKSKLGRWSVSAVAPVEIQASLG